jgi:hypothetical protein
MSKKYIRLAAADITVHADDIAWLKSVESEILQAVEDRRRGEIKDAVVSSLYHAEKLSNDSHQRYEIAKQRFEDMCSEFFGDS